MGVSENSGTPKSSILIGFSIINHPFWGTPIFGNTHMTPDSIFSDANWTNKLGSCLNPGAGLGPSKGPLLTFNYLLVHQCLGRTQFWILAIFISYFKANFNRFFCPHRVKLDNLDNIFFTRRNFPPVRKMPCYPSEGRFLRGESWLKIS